MPEYRKFAVGDIAPSVDVKINDGTEFFFDNTWCGYVLLCFLGSARDEAARAAVRFIRDRKRLLAGKDVLFFGVIGASAESGREADGPDMAGLRFFLDDDGTISQLFGSDPVDPQSAHAAEYYRRRWVLLDPMFRVAAIFPFGAGGAEQPELETYLAALRPPQQFAGFEIYAPILVIPNVFEPQLCQKLISLYDEHGGVPTGTMHDVGGKTVRILNRSFKSRADYVVPEGPLREELSRRVMRRVVPEIAKVHQFQVTRMERYIVGCYDAESGGHFSPHRDNRTKGTAHRRFALSVNLNDDFDGGEVGFPEYGPRTYKAPAGGGVVFSCSLLHCVSQLTRGRRYAFLPFLYDEAAAKIREANNQYLGDGVDPYDSGMAAKQIDAGAKAV